MTAYILYGSVLLLFSISAIIDLKKTKKAILISYNTFKKLTITIIPMMFLVGITLAILTPDQISSILGKQSGSLGILLGLIVGAIAHLPSFVAFPLGAKLLTHGAGYPQIAAFVSSLMAVGIVSLGLEIKYFSKEAALLRNILAVIVSLVFALIIWRVI